MSQQTDRIKATQLAQTPTWVRDEMLRLSERCDDLENALRNLRELVQAIRAGRDLGP